MGISMYIQQKLNPPPTDAMQQKIFLALPFVFTFLLATFPSGLVLYWLKNNVLSIAQQYVIHKRTLAYNEPRQYDHFFQPGTSFWQQYHTATWWKLSGASACSPSASFALSRLILMTCPRVIRGCPSSYVEMNCIHHQFIKTAKMVQISNLYRSFSAVSKRNLATNGSFFWVFRALHLQCQFDYSAKFRCVFSQMLRLFHPHFNFCSNFHISSKFRRNFGEFSRNLTEIRAISKIVCSIIPDVYRNSANFGWYFLKIWKKMITH